MKKLHRPDLFCWSSFDEARNIDFHSYLWVRPEGNVAFDPLALSGHDALHLASLGPLSQILISNSDHVRAATALAAQTGAEIWGPAGESGDFPITCSLWLGQDDEPIEGLKVFALQGSKTPGELAFLLEGSTLITGDLIRAHQGGKLCLLPDAKLSDKRLALAGLQVLAAIDGIEAVLPGDGWPVFRQGHQLLAELAASSNSA
ncbi:MAG: MBL fold metallo-hydrolase [Candidatus Sericytochromatia bacterium]